MSETLENKAETPLETSDGQDSPSRDPGDEIEETNETADDSGVDDAVESENGDDLSEDEATAWLQAASGRASSATIDEEEDDTPSGPSLAEELKSIEQDIESIEGAVDPQGEYIKRAIGKIAARIDALSSKTKASPSVKKSAAKAQGGAPLSLEAVIATMPSNKDGFFNSPANAQRLIARAKLIKAQHEDEGKSIDDLRAIGLAGIALRKGTNTNDRNSRVQQRSASRTPAGGSTSRNGRGGGIGPPPKETGNVNKDVAARLAYVEKLHAAKRQTT